MTKCTQKPIIPKRKKTKKLGERVQHMILNKHADSYGDRIIGGAITVIKLVKIYISLYVLAVNGLFNLWSKWL